MFSLAFGEKLWKNCFSRLVETSYSYVLKIHNLFQKTEQLWIQILWHLVCTVHLSGSMSSEEVVLTVSSRRICRWVKRWHELCLTHWDANSLFGKRCQDGTGFERESVISSHVFALCLLRYTKMCSTVAWPGRKNFVLCNIWKYVWKQLIDCSCCGYLYRNTVSPEIELPFLP